MFTRVCVVIFSLNDVVVLDCKETKYQKVGLSNYVEIIANHFPFNAQIISITKGEDALLRADVLCYCTSD